MNSKNILKTLARSLKGDFELFREGTPADISFENGPTFTVEKINLDVLVAETRAVVDGRPRTLAVQVRRHWRKDVMRTSHSVCGFGGTISAARAAEILDAN